MITLQMVAGRPFIQAFRVPNAKDIWDQLTACEVRAQLRVAPEDTTARLISNLHVFMTKEYSARDIVVTLSLTGKETRALFGLRWGNNKTGYFNLVLSDIGDDDARAITVPTIAIHAVDTTTTGAGDA